MLVQHDVVIFTIYDHEEMYEEMVKWLKDHGSIGRDLGGGYEFQLNTYLEKMFNKEFDMINTWTGEELE